MATTTIKAPVGDPKAKRDKGLPPAKNNPADVKILRTLLSANGYGKPSSSGKVDATLLKCIKFAEIHMGGGRDKDLVIDPGDRVMKSLVKGYNKKKKESAAKVYKVVVNGKTAYVDKKQYDKVKSKLLASLGRLAKAFRSQHTHNHAVWKEYNDVARLEKGFVKAAVHATSSILGGAGKIDHRVITIQGAAVTKFEAAVKSGNLAKVHATLPVAERATRKAYVEVQTFLKAFTKGAGRGETGMVITSFAGFAVVGAMAGPVLVTGASLSAAQAAVAAGSGVAFLESASNQLGRKISGEKVTAWGSAKAVMVDTIVGGLTAGIGAKLPLKYVDDMAGAMAKKVAAKFSKMSPKIAEKIIKKYLTEVSGETIKSALSEATRLAGERIKKGKPLTTKDYQEAVMNILFTAMSKGFLKKLGQYETKVAVKTRQTITDQMVPQAIAKYVSSDKMSSINRARIVKAVLGKYSEGMSKVAFNKVATATGADASVGDMLKQAETYLKSDKSMQKKVDASVLIILKKDGIVT